MGVDFSHNAFNGSYRVFNLLRNAVCVAMGGKWPLGVRGDQYWYWGEGFGPDSHPGISFFLNMPDTDGEIPADICWHLGLELCELVPRFEDFDRGGDLTVPPLERGYGPMIKQFIEGCMKAVEDEKPLVYY